MSPDPFEAPSLEALAALLPAYDFEAFIAQGGMGAVYKARQRRLDRDVAIKILPRELGEDAEFVASFETEAKAMARLNHPNLIGVYDYGEVDSMPYIVMEYVNGKSLFHSAMNLAVDPAQAVSIVKGICDGLAHAHENGVIHRDIKPANILLTPRALPKIGDFGLARPAEGLSSGLVMGTPGYVAPEVLQHPEKADRRSDLFALGVVLYELLIGRCPPYENTPPPSTITGCDVTLDRICAKAMDPEAERRYQSAEEMSADLESWLRRPFAPLGSPHLAPLPAQAPGGPRRAVPPTATYQAMTRRPASSSSGAVAGLLTLAAAIVVGAIGWSKYNSNRKAKAAAFQAAIEQAQASRPVEKKAATLKPVEVEKPNKPAQPETVKGESPLKALARLKGKLAAGERGEMPEGSVALGSTHFMVVPQPMGWAAAEVFAEEHGAHLFVAKSTADLTKLALLMPAGEDGAEAGLWIGAGSAGQDLWSWVDGSPWPIELKPEGEGSYLILDAKGGVQAREAGDRYPFAIQWREDGKNPAALPEMLRRTGESIASGAPVYPPGTLQHEAGRFYVANMPANYSEAVEFAATAGGKLMSPSTRELGDWISGKLRAEDGRRGFWLGGTREDEAWKWANGDPWEYAQWADEGQPQNPGGGMVKIVPGQGWMNAYSGDNASGFIIEWAGASGAPKLAASGDAGGIPDVMPEVIEEKLPPALADLEAKAKQLLENLEKERDKDLAANARTFTWDLDSWHRDLSKNEQSSWSRDLSLLKAMVQGNRVPDKVGGANGVRLSERMAKIQAYCAEKQTEIDGAFTLKASKVRDSYVTRMNAAVASSPPDVGATIKGRIETAKDLDGWIRRLGAEEQPSVPEGAIAAMGGEEKTIVGVWNWRSDNVITFRSDGTLHIHVGETEGEWKLDEEDDNGKRYTLSWDNGERILKVTVASDGKTLEGKNPEGETVRAARIPLSASAGGEERLIGVWKMNGQAIYHFGADGSAATLSASGNWEFESESGGRRTYVIKWPGPGVDRVSIGRDSNTFEGSNDDGAGLSAKRILPELRK